MSLICLINKEKLLALKFDSSLRDKISRLIDELDGIRTTFTRRLGADIIIYENALIRDGVDFFRNEGIDDKHIYEVLKYYYETRNNNTMRS